MTPDFHDERRSVEEEAERECAQLTELIRADGLRAFEQHADKLELLPDGSRALVLDLVVSGGPDTLTIRQLAAEGPGSEHLEILAAKRDDEGRATEQCMIKVVDGQLTEVYPFRFAETFGFGPGKDILREIRIGQFYYPITEGKPISGKTAWQIMKHDQEAGIFQPSGRISV
jgi:hypothetical protein